MGSWSLPRFPQLQTAGNGNDATRRALPASTATRKSGSEPAGTPSPGHGPPRAGPSHLLRLVRAPPIANAELPRRACLDSRDADGYPSNGYLEARPAPKVVCPKRGSGDSYRFKPLVCCVS